MTLVDLEVAEMATGIPRSTLRRWLSTGWIARHGLKPYKVDLAQVEDVKAQRRRV